ncbi:MAG: helical backbone metal receptor [Actinomycetota bacterium]|nr:helical backbone metal receptor [Actinomycetota bacterium]MDQ2956332.1 helical backbone metal receptor [Actinomycetota bacterium]
MSGPELTDDLGASVPLTRPVRRVISLVPSLTEAIAASCRPLLIAATDWCTHPADLDLPRVRGTKNPDLRRIVELRPDLVVSNQEENRELDVQRLRAAGVPVWVTRIQTLDEAFDSMSRLFTQALAVPEPEWLSAARAVWAPPATDRLSAAIAIWRDPWMVVGSRTFTGDLLARLGVRNVFESAADRYPQVSVEQIVATGPQLLLLPDEPYVFSADDGPEAFPGLRTALVSGRQLTWYGPSLLAARAALETVVRL